jgi:hypothetical protein
MSEFKFGVSIMKGFYLPNTKTEKDRWCKACTPVYLNGFIYYGYVIEATSMQSGWALPAYYYWFSS